MNLIYNYGPFLRNMGITDVIIYLIHFSLFPNFNLTRLILKDDKNKNTTLLQKYTENVRANSNPKFSTCQKSVQLTESQIRLTLSRLLDRPRLHFHVHKFRRLLAVPRHLRLSARLPPLQPPQRHQICAAFFPFIESIVGEAVVVDVAVIEKGR